MATGFNLGDKLSFQGATADSAYPNTGTLIDNILPNIYVAAGIIIFFMIILGGFMIISNSNNPDKATDGNKIVTSAIIGLVVLFASYWIIQIIQVITGVDILNSTL